jgi:hypothetical protein
MTRSGLRAAVIGLGIALMPALAVAQSAIVGTVRDTSGAVLPGVTVAASSDVLIEGTRTAFTDGDGLYRIENLRPGTYVVTFSLAGFSTVRREGLQLPSEFTATVNTEMRVGGLEESITVTGDSPVVDVTTAVHTQVLNREAMDAIPTARTIQGMAQLIVGVNLNAPDTGGARAMQQTYMSTHGMSAANTTVLVDGMMLNGLQADGQVQSYYNDAASVEVSYQTSGISADTSSGGVRLNMIPRDGGNRFNGDLKAAFRPGEWQADNLTDRLRAQGLRSGNSTDHIVDVTVSQGGPILRDRLWFFATGRYNQVDNFIPNTTFDDGTIGVDDQFIRQALGRLTWQMSPKLKLTAFFDEIDKYRGHEMQANWDPETAARQWFCPVCNQGAAKATYTATSRLLFEGGFTRFFGYNSMMYQDGIEQPRGSADWFTRTAQIDEELGHRKGAGILQNQDSPYRYGWMASASYVTGSHSIKAGAQMSWGTFRHVIDANGDLYRVYRSSSTGIPFSVPSQVVVRNTPIYSAERMNNDLAFYVQDSWTLKRLTLNAGIRWEALRAQVQAGDSPAGRFVGARSFPAVQNLPDWKNWAPRFSAVYDLFGNAKTALKYSLNRYNQARTTGIAAQYNPLAAATFALNWRDVNGNDQPDFTPGCAYSTVTPGCEVDFSQLPSNFGTRALNTYGAYPRTYDLEHGVEVQHELLPRLSVSGAWYHGTFSNLTITVNRALSFADYTPVTLYNPVTGQPFTAYNRTPASAGKPIDNLDTYDPERKQTYNALNLEFRARPGRGAQVFGGLNFERDVLVNCTAPDDPNRQIFCDDRQNDIPFRTNLKLAGSMPLPWRLTLSGVLQSNSSPNSTRVMTFTRATRYPANCPAPCPAGQPVLATLAGVSSLTVPIEPERATFVERITQLDLKVSRTFQVGRFSVQPALELFNVNNTDAIVTYVTTNALSSSYLAPSTIMQGRLVGVGANVKW